MIIHGGQYLVIRGYEAVEIDLNNDPGHNSLNLKENNGLTCILPA